MVAPNKKNLRSNVILGLAVLLFSGLYSCNDTTPKEETTPTDSIAPMPAPPTDTMKTMTPDTTVTDTSGKGSQPTPPRN